MEVITIVTWQEVLETVLATLVRVVVTVGVPFLFSLLRNRFQSEKINKYIDRAEKLVVDSVNMVNQTFVDSLKAEGKFDTEAQKKAFEMCKEAWLQMAGDNLKQAIIDEMNDIDMWLDTKIESTVLELKMF